MVVDDVYNHFQHGRFEAAIDLIDQELLGIERGSEDFVSYNKLKSRLYYHQGRGDQALYFINEVLEYRQDLESLVFQALYKYGQGEVDAARIIIEAISIEESDDGDTSFIRGMSTYHYLLGQLGEFEGNLKLAEQEYLESLEYLHMLDDQYEINIILYKLGTLARQLGNLEKAKSYLHKSLQLSSQLNLIKEMATTSTLLGQDFMMQSEYEDAIPYLEDGVNYWKEHGSPFGIVWALGELSIINFMLGHHALAIRQYTEIIELAEDVMPPFYLSAHLLNLIRFALADDQVEIANQNLAKLSDLSAQAGNPFIADRLQLASVMVRNHLHPAHRKLRSFGQLDDLATEAAEASLAYIALLETVKLLLLEYEITEESQFKEQLLDEADERIDLLLQRIHLQMGITFELHASVLRHQIEVLRHSIRSLGVNPDDQSLDTNASTLADISVIPDQSEDIHPDMQRLFDFDKEFHSIPSLKILFYLLPRPRVSFSELEKATQLSAGHISGKCAKLEEMGLIIKEKQFMESKPVTTYSITSTGYIRLKQYMISLQSYLENVFRLS